MDINIGAVIVTYNPKINELKRNIKAIMFQVNQCLIVDNDSNNIFKIEDVASDLGCEIVKLSCNKGIAGAQNEGFRFFKNRSVEWVLTLDQDSLVPKNLISEYLKTNKLSDETSGIITASYFDRNWSEAQKKNLMYQGNQDVIKKDFVISSGNLVRTSAWEKVGGFDDFLFIDMVDYDFNAKLLLANYQIWQANKVVLNHAVGEVVHKPILEKILVLPESGLLADHSKNRQYYIYRNSLIFDKRYPMFGHKKLITARTIFATRRMFIYKNSFSKLMASWHGIFDGIKYNSKTDKEFQQTLKNLSDLNCVD